MPPALLAPSLAQVYHPDPLWQRQACGDWTLPYIAHQVAVATRLLLMEAVGFYRGGNRYALPFKSE